MEFLFYWNNVPTGWEINKLPNYNAQLRHWRTSLTQRRLNLSFVDPDGDIYGSLHDSGTALDSAMMLTGRLTGESYMAVARMSCMHYEYDAGITSIRMGDSLERLRSARFQHTWRAVLTGSWTADSGDTRVWVTAVRGKEVYFTPEISLDNTGSVAFFYHRDMEGDLDGVIPCRAKSVVGFGTEAFKGVHIPSDAYARVYYKTPSVVAAFPHVPGTNTATSVLLTEPPVNCGSAWAFCVAHPSRYTGNPMSLLHTFLTATCCDLGWTEGAEFDYVGAAAWNEDPCAHVEIEIDIEADQLGNTSLLSVLGKVLEAGNIDMFSNRAGYVWVSPYRPRYLTDAPDGTIASDVAALKPLAFSTDISDVVNKYEIKYGADLDADVIVTVPELWTGSVGSTHSRTIRNSYLRHADDASCMGYRRLRREYRGVEHVTVESLPLVATVGLSDIERLKTDFRSYDNTLWECVGIRDNWGKPSITIRLADATTYYDQQGWGEWENSTGDNNVVSGTSVCGWSNGTAGVSDGTVNNIDEDRYGSVFRWW